MANEMVISKESAEKEYDKITEYYEIDREDMAADQIEALDELKKIIVKAMMKGRVEITENSEGEFRIKQILKNKEKTEVFYKEIDGKAKVEMEKISMSSPITRCYILLGYLSGLGTGAIHKFKGKDATIAEAIGTTLLLS